MKSDINIHSSNLLVLKYSAIMLHEEETVYIKKIMLPHHKCSKIYLVDF